MNNYTILDIIKFYAYVIIFLLFLLELSSELDALRRVKVKVNAVTPNGAADKNVKPNKPFLKILAPWKRSKPKKPSEKIEKQVEGII